jgi:ATP-dependent protease Clp ATPase subunit
MDVMYDLPSLDEVVRCVVDRHSINNGMAPDLFTKEGRKVELPPHAIKKSA